MRPLLVVLAALFLSPAHVAAQADATLAELEALYKSRKWGDVVRLADGRAPSPELDFLAARALRNLKRHEAARERYQRVLKADPKHSDAAIEAALMLIAPLEQVAHDDAERALAMRAARELEAVVLEHADDPAAVARAAYIAGNVWAIAERDGIAAASYDKAIATGDAGYLPKAIEKKAELTLRGLDAAGAKALWQKVLEEHGRSSAARSARRALDRVAVVGKQAPKLEVELWAKGPPMAQDALTGKVTLVYAFAIWCPHCKREMPHAAVLLDRYEDRGFQVLGLTANTKSQTTADVFPFVEDPQYAIDYPVAVDLQENTTSAFRLTGLPSAALVDRAGIVRWVGHPNNLTEAAIQALLAEPAPTG